MRNNHILLVDDDEKMGALIKEYLAQFGFTVTVALRPSGGLSALAKGDIAAAVFDVMLPEMDGFELCRRARAAYPALPILMFTARGDLTDRVVGLEIGADDYLPKPFEPRELSARLSALLRRAGRGGASGAPLDFAGLRIDLTARRAWLWKKSGWKEIILAAVEFRTLAELVQARPAAVGRDYLIEKLRGFERDFLDRSVDITVSRLRAKLGDSPARPKFIQTVRNEGYAFIAAPPPPETSETPEKS